MIFILFFLEAISEHTGTKQCSVLSSETQSKSFDFFLFCFCFCGFAQLALLPQLYGRHQSPFAQCRDKFGIWIGFSSSLRVYFVYFYVWISNQWRSSKQKKIDLSIRIRTKYSEYYFWSWYQKKPSKSMRIYGRVLCVRVCVCFDCAASLSSLSNQNRWERIEFDILRADHRTSEFLWVRERREYITNGSASDIHSNSGINKNRWLFPPVIHVLKTHWIKPDRDSCPAVTRLDPLYGMRCAFLFLSLSFSPSNKMLISPNERCLCELIKIEKDSYHLSSNNCMHTRHRAYITSWKIF